MPRHSIDEGVAFQGRLRARAGRNRHDQWGMTPLPPINDPEAREEGIEYLGLIRTAGCGVAFDDFGTGFSSLGNLRSVPIDGLKIDCSFVASMLEDGVEAAVVEAIIRLGAALHVAVIAEGIEDAATAQRLRELGCPLGQGYWFARPEPIAALERRLSDLTAPASAA